MIKFPPFFLSVLYFALSVIKIQYFFFYNCKFVFLLMNAIYNLSIRDYITVMTILVHFQIKYLKFREPQPMRKKDMPNVAPLTTHLLHT